jgi:hypothetical protein
MINLKNTTQEKLYYDVGASFIPDATLVIYKDEIGALSQRCRIRKSMGFQWAISNATY